MSADDVTISRLTRRAVGDAHAPDDEVVGEGGCYGWLRGGRDRAIMLELRKRGGDVLAVGYGWIERIAFDPSVGVTLYVPGSVIEIRGSKLNDGDRPLFRGLTRHRVPWIRECSAGESLAADGCVVDLVSW